MSKQFIKGYSKKNGKEALKMGRSRLGTLIRIITGHNGLNYFRSKVDRELSGLCRFCEESDETFWHFATDCPVFITERRDSFLGKDIECEWTVDMLMNMAEHTKIAKALQGYEDIWWEDEERESNEPEPEPEPD